MKTAIYITALLLLAGANLKAQSVGPTTLNATGGTAVIGTSEFEWSIGEMTLVNTFTGTGIVVTQGILQPILSTEGVAETRVAPKDLQVFPNPATDVVNVQYTSANSRALSCRLFDMTGKEISSKNIVSANGQAIGQVDVRSLAAGTYMLEVSILHDNAAPETVSYKIQKLK